MTLTFKYAYVDHDITLEKTGLYISLFDIKELFCFDDKEVKDEIEAMSSYLSKDRVSYIEIEYLPFYDINLLLLLSLKYNPEIAQEAYKQIKVKQMTEWIDHDILLQLEKLYSIREEEIRWDGFKEVFSSLSKEKSKARVHRCEFYNRAYFFMIDDEIKELRKTINLPEDFGEFKDYDLLESVYEECALKKEENSSFEYYAIKLLYTIVTKKPYVNYNDEIAIIAALVFLRENNLIYRDHDFIYSSIDFVRMIAIIKESQGEKEEEVINKLIPLLNGNDKESKSDKDYDRFIAEPSKENAIQFIVSYLEENAFEQGYYEYFTTKSNSVIKLHYSGSYYHSHLNAYQTMMKENSLCFDCDALAKMEAPTMVKNRNGLVCSLFDEIKTRSADDILSQIKTNLAKKLKGKFDLNTISIEINPTWCVESELDYVF